MADLWSTETGLADDYDATVEEMWFGTDSRFGSNLIAYFKNRLDDPSIAPNAEEGCVREQFTCGEKWESIDGGETASPIDGKSDRFAANSQFGQLINRCIKELDMRDELEGRGAPYEAKTWVGLRFHWQREDRPYDFKDSEGVQRKGVSSRILPSRFLGEQVSGQAAAEKSSVDLGALGLTEGQLTALTQAAKESDSNSTFVDRALGLTDITQNDKVVLALANDALWKTLQSQ